MMKIYDRKLAYPYFVWMTLFTVVPLIIVVVNPLVGSQGRTVLFELFGRPVALEKLMYGICMGELLVAGITWFSNAARVMSAEKVTLLCGRVARAASGCGGV